MTHGEDLSDVSDKSDNEEKMVPVNLNEENEQLDFEADGQWKDEKEDGNF